MTGPRMLTAAVHLEVDWHMGRCLEVDVASQCRSVEEALTNLKEALSGFQSNSAHSIGGQPGGCSPLGVRIAVGGGSEWSSFEPR